MATRFWVGGSGNWDGSATTNWSATSGGSNGASVPTSVDDVTIDSGSGTTPTVTVVTGGGTANSITVNKSDGTLTCSTAGLTVTAALTLTAGTLNTGGQTVAATSLSTNNSNTRTLTLGASAITLSSTSTALVLRSVGLTVTANTATITLSGATGSVSTSATGGAVDLNGASLVLSASGSAPVSLSNALTVGNFTRTGTAAKTDGLTIGPAALTVTGNLSLTGNNATNRLLVAGITRGTSASVVVTGLNTLTNVDLMDIAASGAGGTWSGTSVGDCQGNSGITFTGVATRYAVVAGSVSSTATWSSTSGGGGGSSVPLPQDTVFFNGSSAAGTYTNDMPRWGTNIDFSNFTRTFAQNTAWETYGNLTLATGMTVSGTSTATVAGRSTQTLTTAGRTVTYTLSINAPGGTYTMQDAFTTSRAAVGAISLSAGTLADGGVMVTFTGTTNGGFSMSGGFLTATGTWTFGVTSAVTFWTVTGGTPTMTGSTIIVNAASASTRTFAGGGATYGTLTYTVAGSTGQLNVTGSNTFGILNFSDVTNARTLALTAGTTTTVATWNMNGTATKLMTVTSITAATHTLNRLQSGVVSADYLSVDHSIITGGSYWYAGANSTNGGSNTGWIFTAPLYPGLIPAMM